MSRNWLYASLVIGVIAGTLFAAHPQLDLQIARWFFDHDAFDFPVARSCEWKAVRREANWVAYIVVIPVAFTLVRKLVCPNTRMLMAPSVAIFLLSSFLLGPALITNVILKDNWGRPRPHQVFELGGHQSFQPWWRPGGECEKNCSFVSGEASQGFWLLAPASLAPPLVRPVALGAAALFGSSVGTLRMVFGRHFFTDVVFAGVLTILVVYLLHRLLLSPAKRNDARLEQALEQFAFRLHRAAGLFLAGWGGAVARTGFTLRQAGRHLRNGVTRL